MKIDPKELPTLVLAKLRPLWRYRVIVFVVFFAGLCGYLVMQINNATTVAPSALNAAPTATAATPHIDTKVVQQLQQLQDNSVSVQALFNEARVNPFD